MATFDTPQIVSAVNYSWNNQFKEAQDLLKGSTKYPRESLEFAGISVARAMITASKEDKEEALSRLKEADTIAKEILKSDKKLIQWIKTNYGKDIDPTTKWLFQLEAKIVYAEALHARATMQIMLGSMVKGAFNFRNAWRSFVSVQKEINANPDKVPADLKNHIKFNIASYYFFISFAPGMVLKMMELLGFVANKELGVKMLLEIVETNSTKRSRAMLFLLLNYLVLPRGLSPLEENLAAADKIASLAIEKYPNGTSYLWLKGMLESKRGNTDAAISYCKKAIECSASLKSTPYVYLMNLAFCHFMALDWKSAAEVFSQIVEGAKEFEMRGLSLLQLSVCEHLMGNEEKAQELLKKVPAYVSKHSRYDKLALRRAAVYTVKGMGYAPFEIIYMRRDLHHMNKETSERALELLEKSVEKIKESPESEAVYLLIKGVLTKNIGDKNGAKELFRQVLSLEKKIKEETWVTPNCCFEIGEILYLEGNIDEADEYFKHGYKFSNYDFSEMSISRLRSAIHQIKKERKADSGKEEEEITPALNIPDEALVDEGEEPEEND